MIINHIEKQFVTSDAGTIMRELDVEHPAAKLMIMASQMQESEVGDGTNFVVILCGALLEAAEDLLRLGVNVTDICEGYEKGLEKALELLPTLVCYEVDDCRNIDKVKVGLKAAIMSKQFGNEDFLVDLISKACVAILPEKTTFNVDNIRVCKVSFRSQTQLYNYITHHILDSRLWPQLFGDRQRNGVQAFRRRRCVAC